MGAVARPCLFLVRNTNGGTLGGFDNIKDAVRCRNDWRRRYKGSSLVGNVDVTIVAVRIAPQAGKMAIGGRV